MSDLNPTQQFRGGSIRDYLNRYIRDKGVDDDGFTTIRLQHPEGGFQTARVRIGQGGEIEAYNLGGRPIDISGMTPVGETGERMLSQKGEGQPQAYPQGRGDTMSKDIPTSGSTPQQSVLGQVSEQSQVAPEESILGQVQGGAVQEQGAELVNQQLDTQTENMMAQQVGGKAMFDRAAGHYVDGQGNPIYFDKKRRAFTAMPKTGE